MALRVPRDQKQSHSESTDLEPVLLLEGSAKRQCLADTVREGGDIVTRRTVVASLLPIPELSLPLRLFLSKENFDSSAISHVGPKALFLLDTSD